MSSTPLKRRNKPHRPRPISATGGIGLIIKRQWHSRPLPAERQANVVISYHTSIDALCGGYADVVHADTIIYALNIGRLLAMRGLGEEYIDRISEAQTAMIRVHERHKKTGKYALDGPGLVAIRAVADLHEAQMAIATQAELQAAIAEMHRRLELEVIV